MRPKLVVGFAAETNNIEQNSIKKLNEKNCDWIVANDVSNEKIGFDSDFNEVKIFKRNVSKAENILLDTKEVIAQKIVEKISDELKANA